MIFNFYSKHNTPKQPYTPMVLIMGEVMTMTLETIEEVDESEDSMETPSSPLVPARLAEMVSFPYLVEYCKQTGDATVAYLLEKMHREEVQSSSKIITEELRSLRHEELAFVETSLPGRGSSLVSPI